VGTEVSLTREELWGRVDLIRELEEDGRKYYIIQDHKFCDPPRDRWVWPEDKVQLDGYAYLAEGSKFTSIKSAVLLYADIVPREIKPKPERIPAFVERINKILKSDLLPPRGLWSRDKEMGVEDKFEKCHICRYYPLCQVLPVSGRIVGMKSWRLGVGRKTKNFVDSWRCRSKRWERKEANKPKDYCKFRSSKMFLSRGI
jgi:CRISPR/Cas system-associated exonuclease Cas4 (RecB family)